MPKRDQAYMDRQRALIAEAALDVLLEKGVYATSLRDICTRAAVSIGALYIHYASKEEVIVAACSIDHERELESEAPTTWRDYLAAYVEPLRKERDLRALRRLRLSLQFVAEITFMDRNPEGLSAIYLLYRDRIRRCLARLKQEEAIDLPLGIESTTEIHMQLLAGAQYQIASDRELDRSVAADALEAALGLTAGLRSATRR